MNDNAKETTKAAPKQVDVTQPAAPPEIIRASRFVPATGNSEARPFTKAQFEALDPSEGWTRVDEEAKK